MPRSDRDDFAPETDRTGKPTLATFAAAIPGFTYVTVVADPASAHERKGYVTHHLPDAALHSGHVDLYLCGPPPMVDAVRAYLAEKGVKPASFHFEKFNPAEAR